MLLARPALRAVLASAVAAVAAPARSVARSVARPRLLLQMAPMRCYAKKGGNDRKDAGAGATDGKATMDANDIKAFADRLKQSLEQYQRELQEVRVTGAMSSILDGVTVKTAERTAPLSQLAQVTVKDAQNLTVTVFDPQQVDVVATAIRAAGLNLNPIADKNILRVPLPKMTLEYREQLNKVAAKAAEKARQAVRAHRQQGMKEVKKYEATAGKDEIKRIEKQLDKHVDDANKKIDELLERKTKEITGK